jgi:hypothetical protein
LSRSDRGGWLCGSLRRDGTIPCSERDAW